MRAFLRFLAYATWSHRLAAVLMTVAVSLLIYSEASLYGSSLHGNPAEHARFIRGMSIVGAQFVYLSPPPKHLETFSGYIDWRAISRLYFLMPIYCLVVGAAVVRGAEEQGLVEHWLAQGLGRAGMLVARILAMTSTLLLVCVAVTASGVIAANANRVELPLVPLFVACLLPALIGLVFFCVSLLLSQVLPRRAAAAGIAAALSTGLVLLANLSYALDSLSLVRWISPYYLAFRSAPLVSNGAVEPVPTAVLGLLLLVIAAAAVWAFRQRDIGRGLLRGAPRAEARPGKVLLPYPSGVFSAAAWDVRWPIAWWTLGATSMGVLLASVTPTMTAAFGGTSSFSRVFNSLHVGVSRIDLSFISFSIGAIMLPLLAAMVVTVAARWAGDQDDRRTEMVLASGVSPLRLHLSRLLSLAVAAVLMVSLSGGATLLAAALAGVDMRGAEPIAAVALMVPVGFALGTIGVAMMPRAHRLAVMVLSLIVAEGFIVQLLTSFSRLPAWLVKASLFRAYGSPLTDGVNSGGLALLTLVSLGAVAATLLQARTEVETG